jgi:hypothetical protein
MRVVGVGYNDGPALQGRAAVASMFGCGFYFLEGKQRTTRNGGGLVHASQMTSIFDLCC